MKLLCEFGSNLLPRLKYYLKSIENKYREGKLKYRARYAHEIMNQVKDKVYSDIGCMYKTISCYNVRVEEWGTELTLLAKISKLHCVFEAKARFEIMKIMRNMVWKCQ